MPNVRIQIEIQKGVKGVPLTKISSIVGYLQKFLGMLSEDLAIDNASDWIGFDFTDGSLIFVAENQTPTTNEQITIFNDAFQSIVERKPKQSLRLATVAQYATIADPISMDEAVSFSLFNPPVAPTPRELETAQTWSADYKLAVAGFAPLRSFALTKADAEAIQAESKATIRAYGSLQGRIHSLYLHSKPAYFQLRELATGALVKCVYTKEIYPNLAKALQGRNAVLHVFGYTKTDLVQRRLEEMEVDRIDAASQLSDPEFDSLFGSIPKFTGNLTTQEFINQARGREN